MAPIPSRTNDPLRFCNIISLVADSKRSECVFENNWNSIESNEYHAEIRKVVVLSYDAISIPRFSPRSITYARCCVFSLRLDSARLEFDYQHRT